MKKNILIINAHQKYEGFANGQLNSSLSQLAENILRSANHNVKISIIETGYNCIFWPILITHSGLS